MHVLYKLLCKKMEKENMKHLINTSAIVLIDLLNVLSRNDYMTIISFYTLECMQCVLYMQYFVLQIIIYI